MGASAGTEWGTWEELILGGAVLRHGARDWNDVALELQARTLYPHNFTPQVCKAKYEDLQKRYSGSTLRAWFEELRKRRVAELKRELAKSEDSIGSLESKIKSMEAYYASSQTESPSSKYISKDEQSAGSFTKDTKPDFSGTNNKFGVTIKKRRGQRKRKDCNSAVKEGSVCESDNLGSSDVVSILVKEKSTNDCGRIIGDPPGMNNCDVGSSGFKVDNLMEIFKSIAQSEPAVVFRHRMDSQKRARYRKVIKQHLDIGTIRSRIIGQSIKSAKELFRDLLLLANNALVFYSRRTREYKSALSLRNLVMREYKHHCRGSSCHEATSAFLPFNPPVKPRSARPHPRSRIQPPCKDSKVPEKSSNVMENVIIATPVALVKMCGSDRSVQLRALLKSKKGLKRPGRVKTELADTRPKTSTVKQRKRVRK